MVSFIPNLDKIFCKKSFKSLALTALMVSSLGLSLNPANAQTVGPGCDPAFMKAMQQKAWMEAQREIMIAQTTIAKPDSVFSLGCFRHFTTPFGTSVKFGSGNNFNYTDAVTSYVQSAFNHPYGGGHYPDAGNNDGANNDCKVMQSLWDKSREAQLEPDSILLSTLQDIKGYKRGAFPKEVAAPSNFATPIKTFYDPKVSGKSVGANFDDMNLFSGTTAPQSQINDSTRNPKTACSPGIPTGILFNEKIPEVVCPNPGCVSDGAEKPKCCDYKGGNCSTPLP